MPDSQPEHGLREALTAAVKNYAAHVDSNGSTAPLMQKDAITATEAVVAICELMRAADLNPFDVAMWYRRPLPEFGAEGR